MLKIKSQTLEINKIEIFASIGVYEAEKMNKNKFLVSVKVVGDFSKSMYSDKLEDTLDYQLIYEIVASEMAIPADLIEHACHRIADRISKINFPIEKISVLLEKCKPPLEGRVENSCFKLQYVV